MKENQHTPKGHRWRVFSGALLLAWLTFALAWPGARAQAQTSSSPVTVVDASPERTLLELTVSD